MSDHFGSSNILSKMEIHKVMVDQSSMLMKETFHFDLRLSKSVRFVKRPEQAMNILDCHLNTVVMDKETWNICAKF